MGRKVAGYAWKSGPKSLLRITLPLLGAEAIPVFDALQDIAFEAPLDRVVEALAGHAVREIILAGEAFGGVVVVVISFAIAEVLHQPRRRIEDMLGRHERPGPARGLIGPAQGLVGSVGFRGRP